MPIDMNKLVNLTDAKAGIDAEHAMVANNYSSSATYAVGDYVYYNNTLYKCTTAITTAEAWTAAHWTVTKLAEDVGVLKSATSELIADNSRTVIPFQTVGTGFINVANGVVNSSSTLSYTNYIDVSQFKTITYKSPGYTVAVVSSGLAFYDSDKHFVSGIPYAGSQASAGYLANLVTVDVPDTAVYVRFGIYTDTTTYGNFELYGTYPIIFDIGNLKYYLTPEMFGAVGDGITDDTSALIATFTESTNIPCVMLTAGKTYLLTPTNSINGILLSLSKGITLIGNGATIKIANSTPGYSAIIGHASNDLTGLYIENVVFDHNSSNTSNYAATSNVLTKSRMTVYVKNGESFVFKNNVVLNSCSTNTISYNGDGNTENCIIDGNFFLNVGENPNHLYHDHSTIYATGNNIQIVNNVFEGKSWGAEGTTCAIEVHPGNNCTIKSNIISKYHTGINYAAIYEYDSNNGIISNNIINTLRHGVVLFGSTYLTHTTGYSINGLSVINNRIEIHNATSIGNITGGQLGVGGIVTNSSFSLPVKNLTISDNSLSYEIEEETPDYTANYGALGIFEATNDTTYENIIIKGNFIASPPLSVITICSGKGVLKNCLVSDNTVVNPCTSLLTGATDNKFYYYNRRILSIRPKSFDGSVECGIKAIDADKTKLIRPFVVSCTSSENTVNPVIKGEIEWAGDFPADGGDYKLVTKYSDNAIPVLKIKTNGGSLQTLGDFSPSFTSVKATKGSYLYRADNNSTKLYTSEATTTDIFTPSTNAELLLVNLI